MLADAKLPVTFWAEAVNTACYVQNRVLVNKSQNRTPYELFNGTNSTNLSGTKDAASQEVKKYVSSLRYIALPKWVHDALLESSSSKPQDDCSADVPESSEIFNPTATLINPPADQLETLTVETPIPTVSLPVPTACFTDSLEPSNESNEVEGDVSNMETTITTSPTPTLRIHKDHPKSQIIGHVDTPIQTRNKSKENVWTLVDCPKGVRPIGTKWVLNNKKDERGIVIRNKAMLVAQGHTQEEGIDYDEVFTPVARIEAIRLFLAYASFMGFTVYQMDVKSAFLYGTIDEEVYVMQPPRFQDPEFLAKVYKVEKAMYGLHQAPRAWYSTLSKYLLRNGFQRVLQKEDGIFLSQDKYVGDILKKFGYSDVRSSNTPMDKENSWGKDRTRKDVDFHLYRSMIGSLMYHTASRPDIMFAVCACARHQVTPKECYLHAVKRIFRYLKGHPKLGLWDPKESPFDLIAYSDSDYGGATQDRKSTTRGCQFLGRRLISWQCKKQTIMATSTTEAEYVAAASCCGFRISCLIMGTT
nr:retrovirus-related Pol polyprotein from transposon TNT 1-94 [Tanacetum cinerariifolium]